MACSKHDRKEGKMNKYRICQACRNGNFVDKYCLEEKLFICEQCTEHHENLHSHKYHRLIAIRPEFKQIYLNEDNPGCRFFNYCKQCYIFDPTGNHENDGHNVGNLEEFKHTYAKKLKEKIKTCFILKFYIRQNASGEVIYWDDGRPVTEINQTIITGVRRIYRNSPDVQYNHMEHLQKRGEKLLEDLESGSFLSIIWEGPHFENAVNEAAYKWYLKYTPCTSIDDLLHHEETSSFCDEPITEQGNPVRQPAQETYSDGESNSLPREEEIDRQGQFVVGDLPIDSTERQVARNSSEEPSSRTHSPIDLHLSM